MKRKTFFSFIVVLLAIASGATYASTENISDSGLHPQEITRSQALTHQKTGSISVSQDGFTMDNQNLKQEVSENGGDYYVITGEQGHQDHKTIEADMYK